MSKVMILGDTHGDIKDTVKAINHAGDRKISHIFQVGDFGLWTHQADGQEFLDRVQAALEGNNCSMFAIGGNHENWDHWEWMCENLPTHKGFAMVRRRVLIAPKVHNFKMFNRQWAVAGGAVSIDKEWRLAKERGGTDSWSGQRLSASGDRTLYWPNEQLTDQDVMEIQRWSPPADILLTHDCSNYTPFRYRLKPDVDSERHRRRIDEVIGAVKPKVHFHGHMHTKYDWVNTLGTGLFGSEPEVEVQTYGLEANPNAMHDSYAEDWWGILDTDTLEFAFKGEGMNFPSLNS